MCQHRFSTLLLAINESWFSLLQGESSCRVEWPALLALRDRQELVQVDSTTHRLQHRSPLKLERRGLRLIPPKPSSGSTTSGSTTHQVEKPAQLVQRVQRVLLDHKVLLAFQTSQVLRVLLVRQVQLVFKALRETLVPKARKASLV